MNVSVVWMYAAPPRKHDRTMSSWPRSFGQTPRDQMHPFYCLVAEGLSEVIVSPRGKRQQAQEPRARRDGSRI
jgi:hypothetical protein